MLGREENLKRQAARAPPSRGGQSRNSQRDHVFYNNEDATKDRSRNAGNCSELLFDPDPILAPLRTKPQTLRHCPTHVESTLARAHPGSSGTWRFTEQDRDASLFAGTLEPIKGNPLRISSVNLGRPRLDGSNASSVDTDNNLQGLRQFSKDLTNVCDSNAGGGQNRLITLKTLSNPNNVGLGDSKKDFFVSGKSFKALKLHDCDDACENAGPGQHAVPSMRTSYWGTHKAPQFQTWSGVSHAFNATVDSSCVPVERRQATTVQAYSSLAVNTTSETMGVCLFGEAPGSGLDAAVARPQRAKRSNIQFR